MRIGWCACVGGLLGAVGAQEPTQPARAAAIDLEPLRAEFAAKEPGGVQWVAAFVGVQEPLVLTSGTDARGEALTASTLLPLGAMSRLLVADAVMAAGPANVLDEVACTVAGRSLTVGELLRGTPLVPDWFATGPTSETFDRSSLLAYVELAARSGLRFPVDRRGVGELALLADRLVDAHDTEWSAALRARLAPAGLAVDPIDLAAAPEARGRVVLSKAPAEDLARSAAAPLRLALSAGDLLRWWRWRVGRPGMTAEGVRYGSLGLVEGDDVEYEWHRPTRRTGQRVWSRSDEHGTFEWSVRAYPDRGAVLLQFSAGAPIADLKFQFENVLFGEPETLSRGNGIGPCSALGLAEPRFSLAEIEGTWLESVAATPARLVVSRFRSWSHVVLHLDERRYQLRASLLDGDRYDFWFHVGDDEIDDHLLVWREDERQLRCVLLQQKPTSSIPRRLDFTRAAPPADAQRDRR